MMDDKNNIKIIDLGLCAFYSPGEGSVATYDDVCFN